MSNYILKYTTSKVDPKRNCLIHHGIKGQRWGVKNGPPYPIRKNNHQGVLEMDLQFFASKKASSLKQVSEKYPGEFNHVISEINHWATKEQKSHPTITKPVGNYTYTIETESGKIINRKPIPDAVTGILPRNNDEK